VKIAKTALYDTRAIARAERLGFVVTYRQSAQDDCVRTRVTTALEKLFAALRDQRGRRNRVVDEQEIVVM
jgi:DNA-binding MarR family transcriptional regulator